jgi:PhnB protein
MRADHKPRTYTSVAPYLVVDGAARTIDFLVRTFDAVDLRRFPGEAGKKDDADKRGGVKDADGTTWWIATKVE